MKKVIFLVLIILVNLCYSQKKSFKIFQFEKKDAINGHIAKIVKFNKKGLKVYEELNKYKTSSVHGFGDYIEHYFYKDTLLIRTETTYKKSDDKNLKISSYNKRNLLEMEEFKSFEEELRALSAKVLEWAIALLERKIMRHSHHGKQFQKLTIPTIQKIKK